MYGDARNPGGRTGGGGGGGGKKKTKTIAPVIPPEQPIMEEFKEEVPVAPKKKKEEVKRRYSADLSALDPSTFKEKFVGFSKEFYEDISAENEEFFSIGYMKYINMIKEGKESRKCALAEKLLDEGNTKEFVEDPLLKTLMEQLYYKGIRKPSHMLEHASIRRRYSHSYNVVKEAVKTSMLLFGVNLV